MKKYKKKKFLETTDGRIKRDFIIFTIFTEGVKMHCLEGL